MAAEVASLAWEPHNINSSASRHPFLHQKAPEERPLREKPEVATTTSTIKSTTNATQRRHLRRRTTTEWVAEIATLSLCSLTNSYLMISVFPYSGYFVLILISDLPKDQVGTWAGALSSSFFLGRLLTAYHWGVAADRYGRRRILTIVMLGSACFSIAFGAVRHSYTWAWICRFLLGMCNGIMSLTKTLATELARHHEEQNDKLEEEDDDDDDDDEVKDRPAQDQEAPKKTRRTTGADRERYALGWVMGMQSWGLLLSPAVAGYLVSWGTDPVDTRVRYPSLHNDTEGVLLGGSANLTHDTPNMTQVLPWSIFSPEEEENDWPLGSISPYFWPNLVAALLCLASAGCLQLFTVETLPQPRSLLHDAGEGMRRLKDRVVAPIMSCWVRKRPSPTSFPQAPVEANDSAFLEKVERQPLVSTILPEEHGRHQPVDRKGDIRMMETGDSNTQPTESTSSPWRRPWTRSHLYAVWMFTLVTTYIDEAFPLYGMSQQSGLGWSAAQLGQVLSQAGLIFTLLQFLVFTYTTDHCGLYPSMILACILGTWPALLMPLSGSLQPVHTENLSEPDDHSPRPPSWLVPLFLSAVMGLLKLMHSLFFTSMAVAINQTVPVTERATLNGLVMWGNSLGKGVGPILAGWIVATSLEMWPTRATSSSPMSSSSRSWPGIAAWVIWSIPSLLVMFVLVRVQALQKQNQMGQMVSATESASFASIVDDNDETSRALSLESRSSSYGSLDGIEVMDTSGRSSSRGAGSKESTV